MRRTGGKLFAWGSAKFGSLPVPSDAVDNASDCPFPAPVIFPGDGRGALFVKVAADLAYFAALDVDGGLWGWARSGCAIGSTPQLLMHGVVDCSVGAQFIIAATAAGDVYTIGKAPCTEAESAEPRRVDGLPPTVTRVDASSDTFLALTSDGEVWACGAPLTCGTGAKKFSSSPTLVSGLPKSAVHISVGSRHAAAVMHDGGLWLWGDGLSGTLATGARVVAALVPRECRYFLDRGFAVSDVTCTKGQPGIKRNGTTRKCSGGQEGPRTHVVTGDGALWIAGTTHKGLGANHLNKVLSPEADHLSFYRVGGAAADADLGFVVPTGAAEDLSRPSLRKDIADDVLARRMGLGTVESFGANGLTHYLEAAPLICSQPAHIHSSALSADGRLFMWGCGSNGRLGLRAFMRGPGGSKRAMKCYVSTPTAVEALEGMCVTSVALGKYFTLAIVTGPQRERLSIRTTDESDGAAREPEVDSGTALLP